MASEVPKDESGQTQYRRGWAAVNYLLRSGHSWSGRERNNCFVNVGSSTFVDVSFLSGAGLLDDARGVAPVDWDTDGDLELWINNRSSPRVRYMRNDLETGHHYVTFRLVGQNCNRDAIGARIRVDLGDRVLMRTVRAGVNYTVQGTKWVHFGLGETDAIQNVEIRWPDGTVSEHRDVAIDHRYTITQGVSEPVAMPRVTRAQPMETSPMQVPPPTQVASVPLGARIPLPGDITLTEFDGKQHELSDFRGKPLLVNFWASWCPGCVKELGSFVQQRSAIEKRELVILACSVENEEDRDQAAAAAERFKFWFPAGMCDARLLALLEIIKNNTLDNYEDPPLPTSLLLDDQGRVARLYLGPVETEQLLSDVEAMLAADSAVANLQLASRGNGFWERPDVLSETQEGRQLTWLTHACMDQNLVSLGHFYADQLLDYLSRDRRTAAAIQRGSQAVYRVANALIAESPEQAVELYSTLRSLDGGSFEALVGLASALAAVGDDDSVRRAGDVYRAALRLVPRPTTKEDFLQYARKWTQLEHPDQSIVFFQQAASVDPDDTSVKLELASAHIQAGDLAQGIEQLKSLLAGAQPSAVYESVLARALDRFDRSEDAAKHHERVLKLLPQAENAMEHAMRGESLFGLSRYQDAIDDLRPAVKANPSDLLLRLKLAMALAKSGQDAEALKHFEYAIPRLPLNAENDYLLGMTLSKLNQIERAAECFKSAIEIDPDHVEAKRELEKLSVSTGGGAAN